MVAVKILPKGEKERKSLTMIAASLLFISMGTKKNESCVNQAIE